MDITMDQVKRAGEQLVADEEQFPNLREQFPNLEEQSLNLEEQFPLASEQSPTTREQNQPGYVDEQAPTTTDKVQVAEELGEESDIQSGDTSAQSLVKKPLVHILVVSDVVCPWCWVAKRRLENAMESLQDQLEFEVDYSPFLLRPNCPVKGIPNPDRNPADAISVARVEHVREAGENLGLEMNFTSPIVPCSVPALTLRQYVRDKNFPSALQSELVEKLHEAFFTFGQILNKHQLLQISKDMALDTEEVTSYLEDPENEERVVEQAKSWRNQGVQAVPFFFMNGKAACSGAQDQADFAKTILKVAERFSADGMEIAVEDIETAGEKLSA